MNIRNLSTINYLLTSKQEDYKLLNKLGNMYHLFFSNTSFAHLNTTMQAKNQNLKANTTYNMPIQQTMFKLLTSDFTNLPLNHLMLVQIYSFYFAKVNCTLKVKYELISKPIKNIHKVYKNAVSVDIKYMYNNHLSNFPILKGLLVLKQMIAQS